MVGLAHFLPARRCLRVSGLVRLPVVRRGGEVEPAPHAFQFGRRGLFDVGAGRPNLSGRRRSCPPMRQTPLPFVHNERVHAKQPCPVESRAAKTIREIFESGSPLTYIRSSEEQRAGRVLREVGIELFGPAPPIWTWTQIGPIPPSRSTTPGLADRGEARQVRSKPSERGPLDALSGACRVVRRLIKRYAVTRG